MLRLLGSQYAQAQNTDGEKLNNADLRRPHIPDLPYEQRSKLGQDLFDMSRAYEASGEPLLDEHEIAQELTRRRGGYTSDVG
jgi:hypothetical protein